jgi:hypothetical protein
MYIYTNQNLWNQNITHKAVNSLHSSFFFFEDREQLHCLCIIKISMSQTLPTKQGANCLQTLHLSQEMQIDSVTAIQMQTGFWSRPHDQ